MAEVVDSGSAGARVAGEPPPRLADGLIEWAEVPSIPLDPAVPSPPWSMAAIKNHLGDGCDSPITVFPPINHENLFLPPDPAPAIGKIRRIIIEDDKISSSDSDSDSGSNPPSTFSPSGSTSAPCSPLSSAAVVFPAAGAARWLVSWMLILRSRVAALFRLLSSSIHSSRGVFVTFRSVGFTALLIAIWYFRWRRRLRASEQSLDGLIGMIKERDEKINQLLDQMSRMNQILLAIHRVPSSSTS